MKTKHILFLSSWYPSRISPFNGDFVQRHAKVVALQNRVTTLNATRDDSMIKNYEIVQNTEDLTEINVYYKGSFFKPFNYVKRLIALNKGLKKVGSFDLVHLNITYPAGVFALYLKFFQHKKYVITEHWTGFRKEQFRNINFVECFLIKMILKQAEILLPVSNDLGKSMLEVAPLKKMEVIPNVVNTDVFKLSNFPSNHSKIRFLHLSSLKDEHKNISGMLRVAKRLTDENFSFEFHIGGNGSLDWIEQFIQENNLEKTVFLFSELSYHEVAKKMQAYDAFVLFSNYENQPCVQAECFATGLPFIGTDVGGISEFLPKDFGFLIEKGNENELYEALKKIINGFTFVSKEKMNQYANVNFSAEMISEKFNKIYDNILKK